MKLMGSQGPTGSAVGNPSRREGVATDRPTFSLAMTIPVEWEPLAGPPTDALLDRLERSNSGVLATLLKCADLGAPPVEDEALIEALAPLRLKVDMILEMLARMSYRELALPDPRPIELGLNHLRWIQPTALPTDRWLLNKIYFHDVFREPVVLAGRVASCQAQHAKETVKIEVDLAEMSDGVSESFARLVFLEHRRQLALHSGHHGQLLRAR